MVQENDSSSHINNGYKAPAGVEPSYSPKKKIEKEHSTGTPRKKSKAKLFIVVAMAVGLLILAPAVYGYSAHSNTKNLVNAVDFATKHENPVLQPFFYLAGVSPKDYPVMSYALQKGIPKEIAEKLYPVDKMKAGERWLLDQAKTKSQIKEEVESRYARLLRENCPPYSLSQTEKMFIDILSKLPREKQELAVKYAKDGIITKSDLYSIEQIQKLPVKTLKELEKSGHLYPVIDKDKDGIPDYYDPNPNKYNPVYVIMGFPNCDPPRSWYVFDDPKFRKYDAIKMNMLASGFEELGVPKEHIIKLYNGSLSKENVLKAFDYVAKDCKNYSAPPYLFFIIDTHGGPKSIWTPGNKTTEEIIEEKKDPKTFDPRKYNICVAEIKEKIKKIEENSRNGYPVICFEIDACYSDKFLENIFKEDKNKPYFGIANNFITPYDDVVDDADKNRVVDYKEISQLSLRNDLPKYLISNTTAAEKYFYVPIDEKTQEKTEKSIFLPRKFYPGYSFPSKLLKLFS